MPLHVIHQNNNEDFSGYNKESPLLLATTDFIAWRRQSSVGHRSTGNDVIAKIKYFQSTKRDKEVIFWGARKIKLYFDIF